MANQKRKFQNKMRKQTVGASATSPSGRMSRIARLASSFECDPARYLPTPLSPASQRERAHLADHLLHSSRFYCQTQVGSRFYSFSPSIYFLFFFFFWKEGRRRQVKKREGQPGEHQSSRREIMYSYMGRTKQSETRLPPPLNLRECHAVLSSHI